MDLVFCPSITGKLPCDQINLHWAGTLRHILTWWVTGLCRATKVPPVHIRMDESVPPVLRSHQEELISNGMVTLQQGTCLNEKNKSNPSMGKTPVALMKIGPSKHSSLCPFNSAKYLALHQLLYAVVGNLAPLSMEPRCSISFSGTSWTSQLVHK